MTDWFLMPNLNDVSLMFFKIIHRSHREHCSLKLNQRFKCLYQLFNIIFRINFTELFKNYFSRLLNTFQNDSQFPEKTHQTTFCFWLSDLFCCEACVLCQLFYVLLMWLAAYCVYLSAWSVCISFSSIRLP